MSSIGESIEALIENIKVSEHYAQSQRNELKNVENEIARIQSDIKSMSIEREETQKAVNMLQMETDKKEASLLSIENELKVLRKVNNELKELHTKESETLNEKQNHVWKNREFFCNQYRQLSEEWGPMSTAWRKSKDITQPRAELIPVKSDEELQLENDLKNMDRDIAEARKTLDDAEEKMRNLECENKKLREEPDHGEEFIKLQETLRIVQMEVENLERQFEHAKQEQWHMTLKGRNIGQLNFIPERSASSQPSASVMYHNDDYENRSLFNESQSLDNNNQRTMQDESVLWRSNKDKQPTTLQVGVKRPVAAIAPATDIFHCTEDTQNVSTVPKKACSFVPKKPSSLSKKYFTHSNGWMQLEEELSVLLQKDSYSSN